jgi:hypothetical protein
MAAEQIPEPVAATLMIVGALWLAGQTHRRRG